MKTVQKWKWRIPWAGRWTVTRAYFTEDEVRLQHPEAKRVAGSMIVVELPETEAEIAAAQRVPHRGKP